MKTELIVVGKTTNKHFIASINDYIERIHHYMPFSVTVIPELRNAKSLSQDQQKDKEGEAILKLLQPSDTVVLLDERGKEMRSIEMATGVYHRRTLWFCTICLLSGQQHAKLVEDDILTPDGASRLR